MQYRARGREGEQWAGGMREVGKAPAPRLRMRPPGPSPPLSSVCPVHPEPGAQCCDTHPALLPLVAPEPEKALWPFSRVIQVAFKADFVLPWTNTCSLDF